MADTAFGFDGEIFPVTLSLGAACAHNQPDVDVQALIKQADDNLYEAKRGGRNRVVPAMSDLTL